MQKFLLAATAVASIALFAPMSAVEGQSNNEPAVAPAPRTVNLTAEQRFIIKEIVLKDLNVPKARAGAPASIGDPVPSNVELHDMTPELARKVPEASHINLRHRRRDRPREPQRPQDCRCDSDQVAALGLRAVPRGRARLLVRQVSAWHLQNISATRI